jgi:hypothetical protein
MKRLPKDLHYWTWRGSVWAASETRAILDATGRGIYRELLDICYLQGSFTSPDVDLDGICLRLACTIDQFKVVWPKIRRHFQVSKNDPERLENAQANLVRREYFGFVDSQRENGKKRWAQKVAKNADQQLPKESTTSAGYPAGEPMPNKNININKESSSVDSSVVVPRIERPPVSLSENQKPKPQTQEQPLPANDPRIWPPEAETPHWDQFVAGCKERGVTAGTDFDWENAHMIFYGLSEFEKKEAIRCLEFRPKTSETDPKYRKNPKNLLKERYWTQFRNKLTPSQAKRQKTNASLEATRKIIADLERRKQMAAQEAVQQQHQTPHAHAS